MALSDQLKQAILNSGLSLAELARKSGVPRPVLSRFLSEDRETHRDIRLERTADRLADFFGLELVPRGKRLVKRAKKSAKKAKKQVKKVKAKKAKKPRTK